MKLIKNALVYKAELPGASVLEKHLEEKPFTDPLPMSAGSTGFVSRGGEGLVDVFHGGLAFTVRIDEKIIPAGAVKAELEKQVKALCEETGRARIGKKERAEMKDMIIIAFRAKALVKSTLVTCFYDTKNQYLIVPVTSRNTASVIVSLLISAVGSVKTETIHISDVKHGLTTRMDAWLKDDAEAFGDFYPRADVALSQGSQKLTVQMDSLSSAKEALEKAFATGFTIKSMRLSSNEDVSFRLTSDFAFKSIQFPVVPADEGAGTIEDAWLHEASVQVLNLSAIVSELCDMLGYKEPEQEKEAA